jgi:hypothetical protein
MRKFILLIPPVVLLAAIAVGCGGGGKKTITVGNTKVEVGGSLPSNFPKDFPVYKGASFKGSTSSTEGGITGTAATWETSDSVDKVKSYYDQQFQDGPWKSSASGNSGDTAFWTADSSDGKNTAYIGVSTQSGKTDIVVIVGDKSAISGSATEEASPPSSNSSSDQTSTSSSGDTAATLPAEAKLSSDFPTDRVPFPSGARITNTSSLTSGGVKTFYVEVYVEDTPGNVNDYFKNELPKHNWTDSLSSESNGEFFQTYSGADPSSNEGVTLNVSQSDTPGYTKVDLTVMLPG